MTSSQERSTDASRTSANHHILVFFFIGVLVDNSMSLHLNTSAFCLRAQSRWDWLNWFSVQKRDHFVPQCFSKWAQKVQKENLTREDTSWLQITNFLTTTTQIHYSHCGSTARCYIFYFSHINNHLRTRINCPETSEQSTNSSILANPKLKHLVYHKTHHNQIWISLRV